MPPGTAWHPPDISIHAPREGSDGGVTMFYLLHKKFLSTLPARGATQTFAGDPPALKISIHAPREGSDDQAHC